MLTVGNDAAEVERRLSRGQLECPLCGGRLAGWGHARIREGSRWQEVTAIRRASSGTAGPCSSPIMVAALRK